MPLQFKSFENLSNLDGPLSQRVYQTLQSAILTLDLLPGAKINKGEVCQALGVSRSPVSEAISRLSAEGLVDVFPQSGTRVSYFSMAEIREGVFLREAIEVASAAKVALDHTEDQISRLNRNVRLQALLLDDGDLLEFYEADEEFHSLMMQFTGFTRLLSVTRQVSLQVSRARMLLLPTLGRASDSLQEHRAILDAIRKGSRVAAQEAMRMHLNQLLPKIEPLEQERPELFGANMGVIDAGL